MLTWLDEKLFTEIRRVFEPRYKRDLKDDDVETIAINLTELIEGFLRLKWEEKYENKKT